VTPEPKPRRRRRWPIALAAVLTLVVGAAGALKIASWLNRRELAAARAEADRLAPGWRWDELQAARRPVPDAENSAVRVTEAVRRLPHRWRPFETVESAPGQSIGPEERIRLADGLNDLSPVQQLRPDQVAALATEVARLYGPLAVLRNLPELGWGRYPPGPGLATDLTRPMTDELMKSRTAAYMLLLQSRLQAQDGQADAALRTFAAMLGVARSVGDEPIFWSQLTRFSLQSMAIGQLERTLAQSQPGPEALAAAQRLVELERAEPVLVYMVRGEMSWLDHIYEEYEAGRAGPDAFDMLFVRPQSVTGNDKVDRWIACVAKGHWNRRDHAQVLRHYARLVAIARSPEAELLVAQTRIPADCMSLPWAMVQATETTANMVNVYLRSQALLTSAAAALAAERFRLATGRWPGSLGELVPTYLNAVPVDPFDGKPLRFQRLADGLVIYSVGKDRVDDGGDIRPHPDPDPMRGATEPKDYGSQLWDPPARWQPAPPIPPRDHP
jgi:hypothetical protein